MRLGPEIFDAALTPRLVEEHRLAERRHFELDAAVLSVYGPSEPHRCGNSAETVQFSPRRLLRIESTLLEYDTWMDAGRHSFARYQWLQPYRRVALRTVARLIEVATQFGRLACGMDPGPVTRRLLEARTDIALHAISLEDALERVYGTRNDEPGEIV